MPAHRRLSEVLQEITDGSTARISLADLATGVGDRSFSAIMILFAAPNLVPLPPGTSTLFGIPLLIVASQLLFGRPRVWLPPMIANRSVDRTTFTKIAGKLVPWLQRFERVARPRLWPRSREVADRWVGFVALIMAVVLIFPIPLGNWLPAVSVILASLGLIERDGLWVGLGSLAALGSLVIVAGVTVSIAFAALHALT